MRQDVPNGGAARGVGKRQLLRNVVAKSLGAVLCRRPGAVGRSCGEGRHCLQLIPAGCAYGPR